VRVGGPELRKSVALAYVLWFFLGYLGIHRMYCGRVASGVTMLALTVIAGFTFPILIGHVLSFVVAVWWFIDLFLTARMAA
jgi:TM2 domain-containing membrane protein YozV